MKKIKETKNRASFRSKKSLILILSLILIKASKGGGNILIAGAPRMSWKKPNFRDNRQMIRTSKQPTRHFSVMLIEPLNATIRVKMLSWMPRYFANWLKSDVRSRIITKLHDNDGLWSSSILLWNALLAKLAKVCSKKFSDWNGDVSAIERVLCPKI